MRNRPRALVAGLTLAFTLGAAPVPALAQPASDATVEDADTTATDGEASAPDGSEAAPAVPTAVDRAETTRETMGTSLALATSPLAAGRATLEPVSDEMKYFTLFESGKNYDQGFSYGDGYNALGYYQFDRRYSLVSFMRYCVSYDPATFSMFNPVLDRSAELSDKGTAMYDAASGRLTDIGALADSAWHAAYAANPTLFAALQDEYAISNYYRPTEQWLAEQGISMEGRADCVKGLVWSLTNLFGVGGVRSILAPANLSNDMTDREMVNAIVDAFPQALREYLPSTPYFDSYVNRYERERATCLAYIAEDEAAAGASDSEAGAGGAQEPAPGVDDDGLDAGSDDVPAGDAGGDEAADAPSSDAPSGDAPSTDGGSDDSAVDDPAADDPSADDAGSAGESTGAPADEGQVDNAPATDDPEADEGASGADDESGAALPPQTNGGLGSASDDAHGDAQGEPDGNDQAIDDEEAQKQKAPVQTKPQQTEPVSTGAASSERSASGGESGDAARNDGSAMPHTGDAVAIGLLASGSLAAFGATAIYAGKTGSVRIERPRPDGDAGEER